MDLEENITTLLSMGFENIEDIRKALVLGKNDINEAVSILTNEHSEYNLGSDENMKDIPSSHVSNIAPPPYESLCDSQTSRTNLNQGEECMDSSDFPVTNLYELESRIFTDHWSIPYKREESLGKCLTSATKLAEEGLCEVHDNCRRFVERCLPEAFKKLLTSGAVRSWGLDVQEGVLAMLHLFINLTTARLKHDPVPEVLCQVLEKAFDPESEFHIKNKHKHVSMHHWSSIYAPDQAYAVSPGAVSLFMLLLLLLAKGWAITRTELTWKPVLFCVWLLYTCVGVLLYVWNMTEVDIIEDIDEYQTFPGWIMLIFRLVIMVWFLHELRSTMLDENDRAKLRFYVHFGAGILVWFVYLPVVALIALQISALWRAKLLLGITSSADFLAYAIMAHLLWPTRSEQYFQLASESDPGEELEEFNEAPHNVPRPQKV